jgi:hypothetical protein
VPEREVVESVDENMLAGEGCTGKAVSPGDEYTPAGDHATAKAAATEPAAPEMHSATAETAVRATAALCHGWRCHDDYRRHRGRRKAPEQFRLHDSDPP